MEEAGSLDEGWYCGGGERTHQTFFRSECQSDADTFDEVNAVLLSADFTSYGYPNKIIPKISNKRKLEILENNR